MKKVLAALVMAGFLASSAGVMAADKAEAGKDSTLVAKTAETKKAETKPAESKPAKVETKTK